MNEAIKKYNDAVQPDNLKDVCELLAKEIDANLPNATAKISYAQPIWFIRDNPIVGYNLTKKGKINLLFWSGQALKESGLSPEGSFKAAEIKYETTAEVNADKLRKWLKEAAVVMYDYKDIRKNKGKLSLMKAVG